MGDKVEKSIWDILMLLKWEAKLAHWSGTKWTEYMFYITTVWKSIMNREKWKSEKKRQIFFTSPDQKIGWKYLELNFFRLWLHFFAIRGCLRRKCIKQISLRSSRRFLRPVLTFANTPFMFFAIFSSFSSLIFSFFPFSIFLGSSHSSAQNFGLPG